ncbi:hypothetical protein TYRP_020586 [Tyrophagus putrescentiae]|nr:hypothetical protein TYRP_020586 [Tyrophagus putrescentiae]
MRQILKPINSRGGLEEPVSSTSSSAHELRGECSPEKAAKSKLHTTTSYHPYFAITLILITTITTTTSTSTSTFFFSFSLTLSSNLPVYLLSGLLSALVFLNSLGGDFVHDDLPAVLQNADVLGTTSLADLLTHDFWGRPMADTESHKSYRPLTTLTFR